MALKNWTSALLIEPCTRDEEWVMSVSWGCRLFFSNYQLRTSYDMRIKFTSTLRFDLLMVSSMLLNFRHSVLAYAPGEVRQVDLSAGNYRPPPTGLLKLE